MGRTRIKLCGMTDAEQVQEAVDLGVDAIGMIVHANSPRQVTSAQACAIRAVVPAFVSLVGVFVDADAQLINRVSKEYGLDMCQLHGDESPELLDYLNLPTIKAIRARDSQVVQQGLVAFSKSRAILLDPYHKSLHGGTGMRLDRSLWPELSARSSRQHLILAGGLSADNIYESVSLFKPYAVDVNSGVELSPGNKDLSRVAAAIKEVHRFDLSQKP